MYGWMQPESAGASYREQGKERRRNGKRKKERGRLGKLSCRDYF